MRCNSAVFIHLVLIQCYRGNIKRGIGKSVTKRIQRCVRNIEIFGAEPLFHARQIRSSGGILVVADRRLAHAVREAHRQMAGWIFLSGQNIHNGTSALCSREPYLENGFCFCTDLTQIKRTAIEQNNNNIRVNGHHFSEQLHLDLRHIDHGTAGRLAALQIMLTHRHYHEIGLFCCL